MPKSSKMRYIFYDVIFVGFVLCPLSMRISNRNRRVRTCKMVMSAPTEVHWRVFNAGQIQSAPASSKRGQKYSQFALELIDLAGAALWGQRSHRFGWSRLGLARLNQPVPGETTQLHWDRGAARRPNQAAPGQNGGFKELVE